MAFTDEQKRALAIIPKCTAPLSFLGSFCVLCEVLRDRKKWSKPYHRILFSMSVVDLLTSICFGLSTRPIPSDSEGVYNPQGNVESCEAQGFIIQAGIASPIYNFMLCLHFLLLVKYSVSEERMRKQIEPLMQGFTLTFALGTASVALGMGLLNDSSLWCWINALPKGCQQTYKIGEDESTCERGDNSEIFRWAFFFAPLWTAILGTMITMGLLYRHVRERELAVARWNFASNTTSISDRSDEPRSLRSSISFSRLPVLGRPREPFDSDNALSARTTNDNSQQLTARQKRFRRKNSRKSRQVLNQALRYVAVFYLTWVAGTTNRLLQLVLGRSFFWIMALHAAFTPLQGTWQSCCPLTNFMHLLKIVSFYLFFSSTIPGFFNFLVYVYPKYKKWRDAEKQANASQNKSSGRSSSGFNLSYGNFDNRSSSYVPSAHFSIDPVAVDKSSERIRDIGIMEEEADRVGDVDADEEACINGHGDNAEEKESIDVKA